MMLSSIKATAAWRSIDDKLSRCCDDNQAADGALRSRRKKYIDGKNDKNDVNHGRAGVCRRRSDILINDAAGVALPGGA